LFGNIQNAQKIAHSDSRVATNKINGAVMGAAHILLS
jgi:hypothetical protein